MLIIHSKKKLESIHSEKSRKQKKLSKGIFKAMISIVSVMMMFGLSWIFGAFSVSEGAIVFQWLFVIFNTTQGFMLFVFFCVIGGDARDEWKNLLTCNKYRNKVSLNASTTNSHSKSENQPIWHAPWIPQSYLLKDKSNGTNGRPPQLSSSTFCPVSFYSICFEPTCSLSTLSAFLPMNPTLL